MHHLVRGRGRVIKLGLGWLGLGLGLWFSVAVVHHLHRRDLSLG